MPKGHDGIIVLNDPINYHDLFGLTQYDIDVAVQVIKETQTDLKIPQNIEASMKNEKYAGEYKYLSDTINVNYLKNLNDEQATDLLDTVMHETLHSNDPLGKQILDTFRDHPDIEKESDRRVKEIIDEYLDLRELPKTCK